MKVYKPLLELLYKVLIFFKKMSIKEAIYNEIQNTIENMIQQHKFNLYQYRISPQFYRGIESGPYKNLIEPNQWDVLLDAWTYSFKFYTFFEQNQNNPKPKPLHLQIVYDPHLDVLDVTLSFSKYFSTFDTHGLLIKNYSIDQILHEFEHIFLEVPCYFVTLGSTLFQISQFNFQEIYETIAIQNRSLALAMFGHKRLASQSLANSIPPEILPMIQKYGLYENSPHLPK